MPLLDFGKLDWGTVNTIRGGDVSGPASGMTTSASTNDNDLAVYGLSNEATDGYEGGTGKSSRKQGIYGSIHGDLPPGGDGGAFVPYASSMEGTAGGSPVAWWFGLIGLIVLVKIVAEKSGDEAEFKNIRIGATNILIITLSSVIGLTLLKWVFGIYKVPGISPIIEAA